MVTGYLVVSISTSSITLRLFEMFCLCTRPYVQDEGPRMESTKGKKDRGQGLSRWGEDRYQ